MRQRWSLPRFVWSWCLGAGFKEINSRVGKGIEKDREWKSVQKCGGREDERVGGAGVDEIADLLLGGSFLRFS
jgi:hypothetical protein